MWDPNWGGILSLQAYPILAYQAQAYQMPHSTLDSIKTTVSKTRPRNFWNVSDKLWIWKKNLCISFINIRDSRLATNRERCSPIISPVLLMLTRINTNFSHHFEKNYNVKSTSESTNAAWDIKRDVNEVSLTMTVVTRALTSPLCAIVNSWNLFTILSKFRSLPYSANTTLKYKNQSVNQS